MFKTALLFLLLLTITGCGRTAATGDSGDTRSSGDLSFTTVQKSRFVSGDYSLGGHWQMVVQTRNKPEIYAEKDALENPAYYTLLENGVHKEESRVSVEKSNNEVDSKVMLLLDLSGSIIDNSSTRDQLISSANAFISNVIQEGRYDIAIYYFNAKKEILPLSSQSEFPTANVTILKNVIEKLRDESFVERYLKGYDFSTNLYGAVEQAGDKICSWIGCENKSRFEMGSVFIFTDGRDTAGLVSKQDMLKSLKPDIQYYTIGIGDADNRTLAEISGKSRHFEASAEDIQSAFTQAYKNLLYNSSFYKINYCPSTREGTIRIKLFFNDPENKIRAYTEEEKIQIDAQTDIRCDIY